MKHKKKFYFFVFVLALIVGHGTVSWWVGERAERLSIQQVNHLNQQFREFAQNKPAGKSIQLELDTVKRGIWSSQRLLTIIFTHDNEQSLFFFEDELEHGPWPWSRLKEQQWTPVLAYSQMHLLKRAAGKQLYDWSLGKEPLQITTDIDWGGQFNSLWQWAALGYKSGHERFVLGAGDLKIWGIGQGRYQLKAQTPAFSYQSQDEQLHLIDAELRWLSTNPASLYDGQLYFNAREVEWDAELRLRADGLTVEFIQRREDELLNFSASGNATGITVDRGILLGDLSLRLQLERIAEELGAQALGGLTEAERDELWLQSLAAHPRYTIEELRWENSGGRATFDGFFELTPKLGQELEKASAQATIPQTVIQEVFKQEKGMKAAMLNLLLQSFIKEGAELGLLTFEDEVISFDMQYDQSADNYVLNGQTHEKSEMQAILFKWLMWLAG